MSEEALLEQRVYEALGAASVCWEDPPLGVFDSDQAAAVGADLMAHIRSYVEGVRADERGRIEEFVRDLRRKQWVIMERSRDEDDTLGRQDYMIASAEAYAAQKVLDFIGGEQA